MDHNASDVASVSRATIVDRIWTTRKSVTQGSAGVTTMGSRRTSRSYARAATRMNGTAAPSTKGTPWNSMSTTGALL